jgi:UDP-3-O-[3-hydroxymyristoyl] N-acetylglucosamine deacetylase/3-hydroxyacyl-[acyl-carrier-protein] dehydratase
VAEYELHEPVRVTGRDGGYIIAWPSDRFEVSCTNANHLGKHTQFRTWNPETGNYAEGDRAGPHLRFLRGSPAADGEGPDQGRQPRERRRHPRRRDPLPRTAPLRGRIRPPQDPRHHRRPEPFPVRLKAHIYAVKPSHALNVELAREIYKQYKQRQAQRMPFEGVPIGEGGMDTQDIMKVLPHRFPFLLVDRILGFEGTTKIVGQKR